MGNGISKLFAAFFGVILLGAAVGLDYVNHQRQSGPEGKPYFAAMSDRVTGFLEPTPPILLANHLGPAPDGWERRPLVQADAEAITGLPHDKDNPSPDLTHKLVSRLLLSRRDETRISETYLRGDSVIALRIEVTPPTKVLSASVKLARRADKKLREAMMVNTTYLETKGLSFRPLQQVTIAAGNGAQTPVEYRRFWAGIDGRLDIEVMTNASDEDILPVLLGLDVPAMIAMTEVAADPLALADAAEPAAGQPTTAEAAAAPAPEASDAEVGPCVRRAGKLACN